MKFLQHSLRILSASSHLVFFAAIFYVLKPVFEWYLGKVPILGVDFFNSVTYVTYLSRNFAFPFSGFKDIWFGGYPLSRDFISFSYYPMMLFAKYLEPIRGIQIYVLVSLFLMAVFSYLLYFQISKSRVFSLLVTLFVVFSANIYGAAIWGGSLPYFTSQFFLPLTLLLVLKYVQSSNTKWLMVAMIAAGLGFLGHPLLMFGFTMPSAFALIFFGVRTNHERFLGSVFARLGKVFVFGLGTMAAALPITFDQVWHMLLGIFAGGPKSLLGIVKTSSSTPLVSDAVTSTGASQIADFYKSLAKLVYTDTNIWLFWLAAAGAILFAFTFVFLRKRQVILRVLPFAVITLYLGLHPVLNAYGFSLIPQGWYRAFWPFPLAVGALSAALWGEFFNFIRDKFKVEKAAVNLVIANLPFVVLGAIFILIGALYINLKTGDFLATLDPKTEVSSAHPQVLGIKISQKDHQELKQKLIPAFINSEDKNKRLYEADALVNIWWNYMYKMPLVRGYVDPPIATSERGGFFWLDIAIANDSIVRDFKIPEDIALQNALFLIDWYGIYYFEGGRVAISGSAGPSSYLVKNEVFEKNEKTTVYGAILKWLTQSGKSELHMDVPQYLNFYKVKDDFTSPVLYPTNARAIAVFSDLSAYEDLLRALAFSNLNSKYVIPVNAGPYVDEFDEEDFSKFDAVVLNNYKYHSAGKAFKLLDKYVKGGGKVFIDTGNESPESRSQKLPKLFPMEASLREGLGREWQIQPSEDELTRGIKFSEFGPLVFNNDQWQMSYAKEGNREGSKVILAHSGKPILIKRSYGSGEVIWSGMNLLYHISQYKSNEEYKFFNNIFNELVHVEKSSPVAADAKWLKSEKVQVSSNSGARGVLFKEQAYSNWKAKLLSDGGKRLKVYSAGPTFPGFMYVALPKSEPFKLEFVYSGTFRSYTLYLLQLVFILFLLDKIILRGQFTKRFKIFSNLSKKRVGNWWEKEDE